MSDTEGKWEDVNIGEELLEKEFSNPGDALQHMFYFVAQDMGYKLQRKACVWQDSHKRFPPETRFVHRIIGPTIIRKLKNIMRDVESTEKD
jgi:hypothetical protein